MQTVFQFAGKIIGVASGVAACGLWLWAIGTPSPDFPLSGVSVAIGAVMMVIAICVVIASVRGHGVAIVVMFVLSFLPIGIYLLGSSHWLRWIGVANLGFLLAGVMLWLATPKATQPQASVTDRADR